MSTLNLEITGMSCGHCVAAVRTALSELDGVQKADVAVGRATVDIDPSRTTPDAVAEAIRDAGYEPHLRHDGN